MRRAGGRTTGISICTRESSPYTSTSLDDNDFPSYSYTSLPLSISRHKNTHLPFPPPHPSSTPHTAPRKVTKSYAPPPNQHTTNRTRLKQKKTHIKRTPIILTPTPIQTKKQNNENTLSSATPADPLVRCCCARALSRSPSAPLTGVSSAEEWGRRWRLWG